MGHRILYSENSILCLIENQRQVTPYTEEAELPAYVTMVEPIVESVVREILSTKVSVQYPKIQQNNNK